MNVKRNADHGDSVFETFLRVRFHETDALGHVNNASYLNYLEQAAIDHADLIGLNMARLRTLGGVFVARRHDITFLRPAFAGDVLRIVTWLESPRGARIARRYRIHRASVPPIDIPIGGRLTQAAHEEPDGELIITATTEWVFAGERGLPRRIPDQVLRLFDRGGATAIEGIALSNEQ